MTISMYGMSVGSFVPVLESLSGILGKGAAHGRENSLDLANARLAPDMFTLKQQVQIACEHARSCVLRLTGQAVPAFGFTEAGMEDLQAGIAAAIAFLKGVDAAAFEGAETRAITIELPGDLVIAMDGVQLLQAWALPNFYFHVVTAYDILRHNGVSIGKKDYLSQIAPLIRPRG
ncbi:hypothetical protein GCM10010909_25100 [Acidocella aquatica]|uniref:DUF1993 domain-containing protein n=1 Tax=Acidocella aquatica TaxID=1922313 RepID=A0ABQ6ACK9_9PROT|nr:DUF1993 domain-containing protein [Acidocella aquatica]GLR67829.1 hypothetical protein GCM10010909_25100 [Acidocella aquatica]